MGNTRVMNLKGEQGGEYINSSDGLATPAYPSENWMAALCVEDTVLSNIEQPTFANASRLAGPTLAAGYVIYGQIDSVTVSEGLLQMFYGKNPQDRLAIQSPQA